MRKFVMAALVVLITAAQAKAGDWNIGGQDDVLLQATLEGTAGFLDIRGQAWLVVQCRKDDRKPRVLFRVDSPLTENFPVEEYEGPGGLGEKQPLLRVTVGKSAKTYLASGYFLGGSVFEWEFEPARADLEGWLNTPERVLTVVMRQKKKTDPPLEAGFALPASSRDVETMCRKK